MITPNMFLQDSNSTQRSYEHYYQYISVFGLSFLPCSWQRSWEERFITGNYQQNILKMAVLFFASYLTGWDEVYRMTRVIAKALLWPGLIFQIHHAIKNEGASVIFRQINKGMQAKQYLLITVFISPYLFVHSLVPPPTLLSQTQHFLKAPWHTLSILTRTHIKARTQLRVGVELELVQSPSPLCVCEEWICPAALWRAWLVQFAGKATLYGS